MLVRYPAREQSRCIVKNAVFGKAIFQIDRRNLRYVAKEVVFNISPSIKAV